jgi:hypothetical protein
MRKGHSTHFSPRCCRADTQSASIGLIASVIAASIIVCALAFGPAQAAEAVLYNFMDSPDGAYPTAGLISDAQGALYGTTSEGGIPNCGPFAPEQTGCGTVFKLTPPASGQTQWTETVLYTFQGGSDGWQPLGHPEK